MLQGVKGMEQLWRAFGSVVPVFFVIMIGVIVISYLLYRYRKRDIWRIMAGSLLVLSIIAILLVTLGVGTYNRDAEQILNVVPIVGTIEMIINDANSLKLVRNIFLNVMLFMPFGFLVRLCMPTRRMTRIQIIFIGFLLSLCIEVTQYILPTGRWADVDDVILNTLGVFLGCILCERFFYFPKCSGEIRSVNSEENRRVHKQNQ